MRKKNFVSKTGNMFKKASNSVCVSTIVVPRDLLSPTSLSSSGIKTP